MPSSRPERLIRSGLCHVPGRIASFPSLHIRRIRMNASQLLHDGLDALERAIAPVRHLFDEHAAGVDAAIGDLRQKADAMGGELLGDAEADSHTAVGQLEADA